MRTTNCSTVQLKQTSMLMMWKVWCVRIRKTQVRVLPQIGIFNELEIKQSPHLINKNELELNNINDWTR